MEAPAGLRHRLLLVLLALAAPIVGLQTAMPSIKVLPEDASARVGYDRVQEAFGDGAPGTLQVVVDPADAPAATAVLGEDPAVAGVLPAHAGVGRHRGGYPGGPDHGSLGPGLAAPVDRLRADLPDSALVGGAPVENLDLKAQLDESTPLVIGVVLVLGLPAAARRAAGAADLAARHPGQPAVHRRPRSASPAWCSRRASAAGLFGFERQGFLDAWAPVFFFAMIFAIAMDYTVFLLASAKEHWRVGRPAGGDDRRPGPLRAGHLRRGRVMVAVFFTFALSGPVPPKEMGIILGVAVLLDAFLVRLCCCP